MGQLDDFTAQQAGDLLAPHEPIMGTVAPWLPLASGRFGLCRGRRPRRRAARAPAHTPPRLLEAHRLAPGDDMPAWRARLAEALTEGGAELPAALQYALLAIGVLAGPEGEGALRALAAERGVDVAAAPRRRGDPPTPPRGSTPD